MRLFVYGTLRRGKCNHQAYMANAVYLGPAVTEPHFRMFDLGPYPGLVDASEGLSIEGELWEVDEPTLARIEILENTAGGEYERRYVRLATPPVDAILYIYRRSVLDKRDCGVRWEGA